MAIAFSVCVRSYVLFLRVTLSEIQKLTLTIPRAGNLTALIHKNCIYKHLVRAIIDSTKTLSEMKELIK